MHQFYVFELIYFTRALFKIMAYLMYSPQEWFIISLIYACVTIPVWDIIPICYILCIQKKMFKEIEDANDGLR